MKEDSSRSGNDFKSEETIQKINWVRHFVFIRVENFWVDISDIKHQINEDIENIILEQHALVKRESTQTYLAHDEKELSNKCQVDVV